MVLYRNQIAHEIDIPPFLVASIKLLGNLSLSKPSCPKILREVEGVSDHWISKFGFNMLEKIQEFLRKNPGLNFDDFPDETDGPNAKTMKVTYILSLIFIMVNDLIYMKVLVKTRNQVVSHLTDAVARDYKSYAREGRSVVRTIILVKLL